MIKVDPDELDIVIQCFALDDIDAFEKKFLNDILDFCQNRNGLTKNQVATLNNIALRCLGTWVIEPVDPMTVESMGRWGDIADLDRMGEADAYRADKMLNHIQEYGLYDLTQKDRAWLESFIVKVPGGRKQF